MNKQSKKGYIQAPTRGAGYTMIEILVVISIIGFVAVVALYQFNSARVKARDAKRLADMKQVQLALDIFHDENNGIFPTHNTKPGCGGWDIGNQNTPFLNNRLPGILDNPPEDPTASGCEGYRYYLYGAGGYGCDPSKGDYYVLGIREMETSGRPHPDSPGWTCPGRNWNNIFDWVVGKFENE